MLYPKLFCQYLRYFAPEFDEHANILLHKGTMIAIIWVFVLLNLAVRELLAGWQNSSAYW